MNQKGTNISTGHISTDPSSILDNPEVKRYIENNCPKLLSFYSKISEEFIKVVALHSNNSEVVIKILIEFLKENFGARKGKKEICHNDISRNSKYFLM